MRDCTLSKSQLLVLNTMVSIDDTIKKGSHLLFLVSEQLFMHIFHFRATSIPVPSDINTCLRLRSKANNQISHQYSL